MAHLHCRKRTRVQIRNRIQNLMAILYHAEHIHIAQTWTRIPTPYFFTGQESKSQSVTQSVSGNVNESLET